MHATAVQELFSWLLASVQVSLVLSFFRLYSHVTHSVCTFWATFLSRSTHKIPILSTNRQIVQQQKMWRKQINLIKYVLVVLSCVPLVFRHKYSFCSVASPLIAIFDNKIANFTPSMSTLSIVACAIRTMIRQNVVVSFD